MREERRLLDSEVEEIDGLGFNFAVGPQILEDDARRVVSEKKALQLHFFCKILN